MRKGKRELTNPTMEILIIIVEKYIPPKFRTESMDTMNLYDCDR